MSKVSVKFSELKDAKVFGIFAQPRSNVGAGDLVILAELSNPTRKGFLIFEQKNLCEIKPGIDICQMNLSMVTTQIPNLTPIVNLGSTSPIQNLTSPFKLGKKLSYRGAHDGKYWFESEYFTCFDVLGFQVGDYWLQWYYRRSLKAPQFVTDWVVADQRPFSSPIPVLITDERCGSPTGYVGNNVLSSGGILEMIFSAADYRHQPFLVDGNWRTIQGLLVKGNLARDAFYTQMKDTHSLPVVPSYIHIGTELSDEKLDTFEENIQRIQKEQAKKREEIRQAMLKRQEELKKAEEEKMKKGEEELKKAEEELLKQAEEEVEQRLEKAQKKGDDE